MPIFDKINSFLSRFQCADSQEADLTSSGDRIYSPSMFELEQRVLYDASPLTAVMQPAPFDMVEPVDVAELMVGQDVGADIEVDEFSQPVADDLNSIESEFNSDDGFAAVSGEARQLVVIDSGVENHEELIASLDGSSQVLLLDANQNGIEQITQTLRSSQNSFGAIHIVSHG